MPVKASGFVTIGGLNPALTYDLLFYGSRSNLQNILQTWHVTQTGGTVPADVTYNSLANSTTFVDWKGLVPTSGGVIQFSVTGPDLAAGALALNFGSITEVPEPSSVLALGLAGSLLGLRRRR